MREEELVRSNALDLQLAECRFGQRPKWGRLDLVAVGPPETQEGFCWVFHRNRHHLKFSERRT